MTSKQAKYQFTMAVIFSIIASGATVLAAFLFRDMVAAADLGGDEGARALLRAVLLAAGLFVVDFIISLIAVRFRLSYTFEMLYLAKRERMKFIFGRRLKTPAEDSTKDLSFFTADIDILRDKYFRHKALVALRISNIVFALTAMIIVSPLMTLVSVGLVVLLALTTAPFGKGMNRRTKAYSATTAEYVDVTRECIMGQREILAYDKEEIFLQRHDEGNRKVEKARMKSEFFETIANFVAGYSNFLIQFAAIGFGSYLVLFYGFDFGGVVAITVLVSQVGWPATQFVEGLNGMRAAKGLYEKAKEKAEQEPSKSNLPNFNNIIEIKGLGLKYDEDAYVVKDLDLSFKKGGKYAVFAPSGYGKTSIARALALEFLEYDGTITVDGQELRDISISDYNKIVRYVRQDPYLFSDTAINNLTFFGERPPQEDLNYALSVTRVSDFLPTEEDLQRQISNTSGLSGGQKQRIVLARALLHKPKVLILDEITSGVDLETACAILADIFKDKDLTVIAITHENDERFQSLFDKIVRLDER